jgi:hypothetical protein
VDLGWLTSSNPVAIWWSFLIVASGTNIALWLALYSHVRRTSGGARTVIFRVEPLVLLSAAYVFGCAFRSMLPRADVQRICLFDSWLSSVFVGRSVATVAEICFVVQWAIVLRELGRLTNSDTPRNIAKLIAPLIVIAECCSWYAVITTSYLGNVVENSLWTATFALIGIALVRLLFRFRAIARGAIAAAATGVACYVVFMCMVDVPTYFARWQADIAGGKRLFGLFSGLHDVATHWTVTHDITRWDGEIAWMSLYFSTAVWASLLLAGFSLVRHLLPRYLVRVRLLKPVAQPVPLIVRSR